VNDSRVSKLAQVLAIALIVATLINGMATYLKRTGLAQADNYVAVWAVHCHSLVHAGRSLERQCFEPRISEEMTRRPFRPDDVGRIQKYIYKVDPSEFPLKVVKDVVTLWICGVGWLASVRNAAHPPKFREAWPLWALACYAIAAWAFSLFEHGAMVAMSGARTASFIAVALLSQWVCGNLAVIANGIGFLILVQLALLPFEMIRGIHLFHEWDAFSLAARTFGTMVQPNSLGVFAVIAGAFYFCFSTSRRKFWVVGSAALAVAFVSGSGTGVASAAVAGLLSVIPQIGNSRRQKHAVLFFLLGGLLLWFLLPIITLRADIFDSVLGDRLSKLQSAISNRSLAQILFGSGLGVNSNAALNSDLVEASDISSWALKPTDSALTGWLIQIGVIGTLLFYSTLIWAAMRDRSARPLYGTLILCSLTLNITEIFPVNILLGLALAHSTWGEGQDHDTMSRQTHIRS
jgi:hypothetical protein